MAREGLVWRRVVVTGNRQRQMHVGRQGSGRKLHLEQSHSEGLYLVLEQSHSEGLYLVLEQSYSEGLYLVLEQSHSEGLFLVLEHINGICCNQGQPGDRGRRPGKETKVQFALIFAGTLHCFI